MWPATSKQVEEITPHMDDFDAEQALIACAVISGCAANLRRSRKHDADAL